ncbi:MAG: tRNA(His) guanylyltransferase Thg1 family protein [Polyangiaceae bacterium]|nr:tRNA(His) guanylyltransferase Thg1 family protein [Polyangiaceae bacterium]
MPLDKVGETFKVAERATDLRLPPKQHVIVRLDGNSFSRLTRTVGCERPFDRRFSACMEAAVRACVEYASGAVLAYSQSDEISIWLRNDRSEQTEPFVGNRIQKLCSLLASRCSVVFNEHARDRFGATDAIFDCRAFTLPTDLVAGYFAWRMGDAFVNCVQAYAQKHIGKSRIFGKSTKEQTAMLMEHAGINVARDIALRWRRGFALRRVVETVPASSVMPPKAWASLLARGHAVEGQTVERGRWVTNDTLPIWRADDNPEDLCVEPIAEAT